jgi:alkyl sulfatase BDS1-like metallo-beta-lactamase superfamily hydrolase
MTYDPSWLDRTSTWWAKADRAQHNLRLLDRLTDTNERYRMELCNGALIHHPTTRQDPADLTITLTKLGLLKLMATRSLDGLETSGDPQTWTRILALTDRPDPDFPIVTP